MNKILKLSMLILLLHASDALSDSEDCFFEIDGVNKHVVRLTSQLSMLKSYQMKFNLNDPKADAIERLKVGDFRLLSMAIKPRYPVSEKFSKLLDEKMVCLLGERFIEGVSNTIESNDYAVLADKFIEYAVIYNETILTQWKKYYIPSRFEPA